MIKNNRSNSLILVLFLFLPFISHCGASTPTLDIPASEIMHHSYDAKTGHVYFLKNGMTLVSKKNKNTHEPQMTFFYHGIAPREAVVSYMVRLLKLSHADKSYVKEAGKKLMRIGKTEEETFKLRLRDINSTMYRFLLSNTGYNQLNILSYKLTKAR